MKAHHVLLALLLAAPATAKEKKAAAPEPPVPVASSATAVTPEMDAAVRKLLEVSGALQAGKNMERSFTEQMAPMIGRLAGGDQERLDAMLADMTAEFDKHFSDEVVTRMTVECYAKYMSLEDVRAIAAFNETPAGRRIMKATPLVMQESVTRSMTLMQEVLPKVLRAMAVKYPETRTLLPEEGEAVTPEEKPDGKPAEKKP